MNKDDLLSVLLSRAAKEADFQACWRRTADAETAFLPVQDILTEQQAELLNAYLSTRQELALALMAAAYEFGLENGSAKE